MKNTRDNKKDREEFESWYQPPFDNDGALFAWTAWQASRKQALEEAAKVCDELHNYKLYSKRPTPSECAFFIRELYEH
jgi:hypothetical protein